MSRTQPFDKRNQWFAEVMHDYHLTTTEVNDLLLQLALDHDLDEYVPDSFSEFVDDAELELVFHCASDIEDWLLDGNYISIN